MENVGIVESAGWRAVVGAAILAGLAVPGCGFLGAQGTECSWSAECEGKVPQVEEKEEEETIEKK